MRTVLRYENGWPVWSENVPAEYITFGPIGGSAIEARPSAEDLARAAQRAYKDRRKLRGTGLEP